MIMVKLALRSLRAHLVRLLLTVLSVVLAVAFTTGTLIITDAMDRSVDDLFANSDRDIAVVVRPESGGPALDLALADEIADVPGVTRVLPMAGGEVELLDSGGDPLGPEGTPQAAAAWHDRPDSQYRLVEGEPPGTGFEAVVESGFAEEAGLSVGDGLVLRAGDEDTDLTVVGLYENSGLTAGSTVAALDAETARELLLGSADAVQEFYVAGDAATTGEQESLAARIEADVAGDHTATAMDQVREDAVGGLRDSVAFLGVLLVAFAAIALFVGAFLIVNTFSMLVAQRSREFALLRAVGAGRGQVGAVVLAEAFGTGLVGSVVGIGGGIGLAHLIVDSLSLSGMEVPPVEPTVTPLSVVAGCALGIVVTTLAAYGPQRRAAKVPPVAALRDSATPGRRSLRPRAIAGGAVLAVGAAAVGYGLLAGGSGAVAAVGGGAALAFTGVAMLSPFLSVPVVSVLSGAFPALFGAPGRLARNNSVRDPRRTASTAMALMVGLGLVAAIGTISQSAMASVEDQVDRLMGADYVLRSSDSAESVPDAVLDDVAAESGVSRVVPVSTARAEFNGTPAALVSAEADGLAETVNLEVVEGTADPGRDELLVNSSVAEERGWGVGSRVTAVFADGSEQDLTVAGVYADNNLLGAGYLLGARTYEEYVDEPLTNLVYVTADAADQRLTEALTGIADDAGGVSVMDRAALKEDNRELFNSRAGLVYGLLALSILIAALGIANTLTLSTWERTREIGLLRAVGMFRSQVQRMVRLESVVISVFGALLGIVVGVSLAAALQTVLTDLGVTVLAVPFDLLAVLLGLSVVLGVAAALWPAWRASRVDILRAIATH